MFLCTTPDSSPSQQRAPSHRRFDWQNVLPGVSTSSSPKPASIRCTTCQTPQTTTLLGLPCSGRCAPAPMRCHASSRRQTCWQRPCGRRPSTTNAAPKRLPADSWICPWKSKTCTPGRSKLKTTPWNPHRTMLGCAASADLRPSNCCTHLHKCCPCSASRVIPMLFTTSLNPLI
jgi:hypothetical protein